MEIKTKRTSDFLRNFIFSSSNQKPLNDKKETGKSLKIKFPP